MAAQQAALDAHNSSRTPAFALASGERDAKRFKVNTLVEIDCPFVTGYAMQTHLDDCCDRALWDTALADVRALAAERERAPKSRQAHIGLYKGTMSTFKLDCYYVRST